MLVTPVGITMFGQARALTERPVFDAGDAIGNHDAGQAGTLPERPGPDGGDGGGEREVG